MIYAAPVGGSGSIDLFISDRVSSPADYHTGDGAVMREAR
jgi:hypothetical protein